MEYRIARTKQDLQKVYLFRKKIYKQSHLKHNKQPRDQYDGSKDTLNFIAIDKGKIVANVRLIKQSPRFNNKLPIEEYFSLANLRKRRIKPVEFSQLLVSNELTNNDILIELLMYVFQYAAKNSIKYLCTSANAETDDSRSVRIMYRVAEIKNLIHPFFKTLPNYLRENPNPAKKAFYDEDIINKTEKFHKFNYNRLKQLEKNGFRLPFALNFYLKLGFQLTSVPVFISQYKRYAFPLLLEIEKTKIKNLKFDFNRNVDLIPDKEINCRSAMAVIQYMKNNGAHIDKILKGIRFSEEYLMDENNWVDCQTIIDLFNNAKKIFKDNNIGYKIGKASTKLNLVGIINLFYRLISNPLLTFKMAHKMLEFWDRVQTFTPRVLAKNKLEVIVSKGPVMPTHLICEWNKGIFESVPEIWNLPTKVIETECVRHGDLHCKYIVEWEPQKSLIKRIYYATIGRFKTLVEAKELVKEKYLLQQRKFVELKQKTEENIRLNELLNQKNEELRGIIDKKIAELEVIYKKRMSQNKDSFKQQKTFLKENVTGIIAHEIKNSLNSLNIIYDQIRKENLIDQNKDHLVKLILLSNNNIEQNSFRSIVDLIDEINNNYKDIDYTIIQLRNIINESLGMCKLILSNYSMHDLQKDNITSFLQKFYNHKKNHYLKDKIDFSMKIKDNVNLLVNKSDVSALLDNIISNSYEALKEINSRKRKKIAINTYIKKNKNKKNFIIEVVDNGPGIPNRFRSRIFDPFYTTSSKKLGLGLTFCKKIMKKYNGEIKFNTQRGVGTKLYLHFPMD